jgi:hypothetical protein
MKNLFLFSRKEFDFSDVQKFLSRLFDFYRRISIFFSLFHYFHIFKMDDDSVIQVIVRFYKEAVHEFLLSSSCHSVLFRGFINRDLQLIAPLHGHNPTMEYVYHEISQSLGVRLKKMILTFD